jgi:hypothetical protein
MKEILQKRLWPIQAKFWKSHGWVGNGEIEQIEGVTNYPPEYFCPMDYQTGKLDITPYTRSIHWYTASWQSSYSKANTKLQQLLGPSLTFEIIDLKKKFKSFIHGKWKCMETKLRKLLGRRKLLPMQTKMSPSAAREILQNYSPKPIGTCRANNKVAMTTIYRL